MSSINAAAIAAKHRGNAEGSVRVLGQTAAVAGISGALLLALKAMVLVAPAVLPGGDGLDALGRPNAVAPAVEAAPVTFTPASADTPIGSSERTAPTNHRSVVIPTTTTKPATTTNTPSTTDTPATPAAPSGPTSGVGQATDPITKTVDGLLGTNLGKTVDNLGSTVKNLPVVGPVVNDATEALAPVTDGLLGDEGLLAPVVGDEGLLSGVTGDEGLLSGVTGRNGLLGGLGLGG
jgi:hypothetical protein